MMKTFPVVDMIATGENISRLRERRGLTVREVQEWFGFAAPQTIYKWQKGKCLPSGEHLLALSVLLEVSMDELLIPCTPKLKMLPNGQKTVVYCPALLSAA